MASATTLRLVRHALRDEHADERRRDDPGLAGPREEHQLLAAPAAPPVGEEAGEDGQGARDEDQRCERNQGRHGFVLDRPERQVRAERQEDEDDDDVRGRLREDAHLRLAVRMHAEPELVHVGDDQPGEEGAEVAAAAGVVDREVAPDDHEQHRDRGRLPPDPDPPGGDDERQGDPEDRPQRGRDEQVDQELPER